MVATFLFAIIVAGFGLSEYLSAKRRKCIRIVLRQYLPAQPIVAKPEIV